MQTQTMNKAIKEALDPMVGKSYLYNHNVYLVKNYTIHQERERVFVHTDQKDFDRPFDSIINFMSLFTLSNGKPKTVSFVPPTPEAFTTAHKPSSVIVHETSDYSRFKLLNGNRQLNERKISKIIKEITNGNDMLRYYPIQVKESGDRLDILDGQHRFFIDKKLKRPVYYILVQEEKSMPDIAKINSNVEKWKASDFINCYIQYGNENYKTLQSFLDTYKMSLTVALQLLNLGNPGSDHSHFTLMEDFKNGTFEIKKLEESKALAKDCFLFDSFSNRSSRSFVIAIYRIQKANKIPFADLLEAYKKRPEMLTQQANYKAYVNTLEQIVNVGKKYRIVIV